MIDLIEINSGENLTNINTENKTVTIVAWFFRNVPAGDYTIYIGNKKFPTTLSFRRNHSDWNYISQLLWIPVNSLTIQAINKSEISGSTFDEKEIDIFYGENKQITKFLVAIKPDSETYVPIKKRTLLTKEFCSGVCYKNCTLDPDTNKPLEKCMFWRRTDSIGNTCRLLMDSNDENKSIKEFCDKFPLTDDCKCINRQLHQDFLDNESKHQNQHVNCWYGPCKNFLRFDKTDCPEITSRFTELPDEEDITPKETNQIQPNQIQPNQTKPNQTKPTVPKEDIPPTNNIPTTEPKYHPHRIDFIVFLFCILLSIFFMYKI